MPKGTRVARCVEEVKKKGGKANPYAVCQSSTDQSYATGRSLKGLSDQEHAEMFLNRLVKTHYPVAKPHKAPPGHYFEDITKLSSVSPKTHEDLASYHESRALHHAGRYVESGHRYHQNMVDKHNYMVTRHREHAHKKTTERRKLKQEEPTQKKPARKQSSSKIRQGFDDLVRGFNEGRSWTSPKRQSPSKQQIHV